ncbi:hypothetical protein GQ600_24381 [Phytophthora cactorum]|nr:hypothetical protein GQ600_24381 [Phytophthora cactorum]
MNIFASMCVEWNTYLNVASEIYALRPCMRRSVRAIMPLEMRQIHERLNNTFNGVQQPAGGASGEIIYGVTIRHILDYGYYKSGAHTPPAEVGIGESIFDDRLVPAGPDFPSARPGHLQQSTDLQGDVALTDGLMRSPTRPSKATARHEG